MSVFAARALLGVALIGGTLGTTGSAVGSTQRMLHAHGRHGTLPAMEIPLSMQIPARTVARRTGLTRLYWRVKRRDERAFEAALEATVVSGCTVWDIGANVGHYAAIFSDRVGPNGHVVAFEPAPDTFSLLAAATEDRTNVTLVPCALGAERGTAPITIAADATAGVHSLVTRDSAGAMAMVAVERGDDVRAERNLPVPTVIKIDVEGFEYEVIQGLARTLADPTCRAVLCEVHFGVLAHRKLPRHPKLIEDTLRGHGFTTSWVDPSHLRAAR